METTDVVPMKTPVDLVDRVRRALSGYPNPPEEVEKKISNRVDGRTKAFKATLRRIESRRTKKTIDTEEE